VSQWSPWKRKIAVTGLSGAGKTVFLLSLLQHIELFRPDRLRISPPGAELRGFKELPPSGGGASFPRKALRARLMEENAPMWPEKTRDVHHYSCSFRYTGWTVWEKLKRSLIRIGGLLTLPGIGLSETVDLDFLDFPGERLADVDIARYGDYASWADQILEHWTSYSRTRERLAGYLDLVARDGADEEAILDAYKNALTGMLLDKNQIITPSTFSLGVEDGGVFGKPDVLDRGRRRLAGLAGEEFSPLPRECRGARPDLADAFAQRYRHYREQVVLPLFDSFSECDRIILLLDIPGILSGGVGRLNDAGDLIDNLASVLRPSKWHNFFSGVENIAFVAAKCDLVHNLDHDNLMSLLEDIMRPARNRLPDIGFTPVIVSAWVSSRSLASGDGRRILEGVPLRGNPEMAARTFVVPELPSEWPADWAAEDPAYSYPRLAPGRLANRWQAPAHFGMEKILDFILSARPGTD
jgi:predicted YcjX-like family ATPase